MFRLDGICLRELSEHQFQDPASPTFASNAEEVRHTKNTKRFAIQPISEMVQEERHDQTYPNIHEPKPELVPSGLKTRIRLKYYHADLKITQDVPDDANTRSAEYRIKIRAHYDSLQDQFPSLSCADYARANKPRLNERTFQKWCLESSRASDKTEVIKRLKNEGADIADPVIKIL